MKKVYYLFVDTETTGLNFDDKGKEKLNKLLEISWILTTKELNIINKGTKVVHYLKNEIKHLLEPKIYRLHENNNLLNDCCNSNVSIKEIDDLLCKILDNNTKENSYIILAGSSVHFDKEIIRRNLPKLYNRLHYRNFDISSLREGLSIYNKEMTENTEDNKSYIHRAKEDIEETFDELKTYLLYLMEK